MKKILSNVYLLAALFMIGAAITSCSKSDDTPAPEPKPVGPTTYTMTIKATKTSDAKTRALSFDGDGKLNATWSTTENVYVKKGSDWATGSLKPQADGGTAVLKGSLSGITIAKDDNLFLQFPKSGEISYEGQLGTLSDIAANFDWATATIDVESVSASGDITPKAATTTFTNKQAIVKFTLTDYNGAALPSNPSALTVNVKYDENNEKSISLTNIPAATYEANGNGVLYVAIPGFSAKKVTLTATVGSDTYTYVRNNVTFANGQYYAINVSMVNPYKTPLTFVATRDANGEDDGKVSFANHSGTIYYYSSANKRWEANSYEGVILLKKAGDMVSFKGDNVTNVGSGYTQIICKGSFYVYGNIMSLISKDGFTTATTLTYDNTFVHFFEGQDIRHAEGKDLVLPATTLQYNCYSYMFSGCSNLDQAPELPAETLAGSCYSYMFKNCSSLKYIKCLAKNTSASECTTNWVENVAGSGTFVVNSDLTLDPSDSPTTAKAKNGNTIVWDRGNNTNYVDGIPYGWTVKTVTTE